MFKRSIIVLAVLAAVPFTGAVNATPADGSFIVAREASEGPRGRDNERPGDRQRRGGRG